MENLRSRFSDPKSRIILLAGGIILLGVVAWGIGWGARALFDRPAAQSPTMPAETVEPTVPPAATPTPTAQMQVTPSPTVPTNTPPPTSTPVPSATPPPTEPAAAGEWEVVQSGEGLYMVCRRHCPARWPPDDADLEEYARQVAQLNSLLWPDPLLSPGQELQMPPCP